MDDVIAPEDFRESILNASQYPLNLTPDFSRSYYLTLQRYKDVLDSAETDLFLEDDRHVELPVRDLYDGKLVKENIHSEARLTAHLGILRGANGEKDENVLVRREQPKCRFLYMYAENSRDQLRLTRKMMVQIFTFHQVMPAYLDCVSVFGAQSDPRELRFSCFRELLTFSDGGSAPALPHLNKRRYELCYNLKGVSALKDAIGREPSSWSVRQAAIYHQFDVDSGNTVWIVTKGRRDIYERFKSLTGKDARPEDNSYMNAHECFRSSLAAQLMYCQWATEDWRGYLRWMEDKIEQVSSMALFGSRERGRSTRKFTPADIQDIQYWKDKASEVTMLLNSNIAVIRSLQDFYMRLGSNQDFPLHQTSSRDIERVLSDLNQIISELGMHASRASLLVDIVTDRKELILQHLQSQAAERTEQLSLSIGKETIVMRIITLVTLLYLPATFVSTFFSTDVVKYQNLEDGSNVSFSAVALSRWLQVTIPLTTITMLGAWASWKWATRAGLREELGVQRQSMKDGKSREGGGMASWGQRTGSRLLDQKSLV